MLENSIVNARGVAIARAAARVIERRALRSVRTQLEAAGGTWADHEYRSRAAVRAYLNGLTGCIVLHYLASDEAAYSGPADEAFPRAVRRTVRRVGVRLPAACAIEALGAICTALGEDSDVTQQLRAAG